MALPQVLYEDNHLLVFNKPAGVLVQGDDTGDKPLVAIGKDYIKQKYNKPGDVFLGVVHRLDRPVSGVVVMARTSKSLERMNALFRNKETTKIYFAVTNRIPQQSEGTLINWLTKDERKNKATAFLQEKKGALRSELKYRVVDCRGKFALIEVQPLTGRPHQIRVQLAFIGCPIAGDLKYGYEYPEEDGSICLHAHKLSFIHPVRNTMLEITAPMPQSGTWRVFNNNLA